MTTDSTALSDAVLGELLAFLSVEDFLALERVDRAWQQTLANKRLWRRVQVDGGQDCEKTCKVINQVADRHGSHVERLILSGCVVPKGAIVKAANHFVTLTHLVVSGCQTLANEDFIALVRASNQQLVEVRAVKCLRLTDAALQAVAEHHSQSLECINFSYCRQISKDGVAALARRCGKLRSVKIKSSPAVTSSVVATIAESCPNLDTLLVGGAKNLTDEALLAIADHCPLLMSLDISRSNPFGLGRGGVTDGALVYLASRCSFLKRLYLSGQGLLSPSVLGPLANSCPKLETLDLGGCRGIIANPMALGAQLRHMNCLHELSVAFTRSLKSDQIDLIASQCPQLKAFRVDGTYVAPLA
ncbi:hypothetical protein PHYBOEH_011090 [Phytophthora boehmeriae]|uniref:F-box domain-containing protein n=1 Tax=Phytophthora boehmeriae TaxID=109152 RepID=A0A8T1X3G7_9STRA|nr:hypothetical protein PHYBOEH_011090 [Phytophthora boehmeriae]